MRVLTAQQGVGSISGGVTLVTQQLLSLRQLTRVVRVAVVHMRMTATRCTGPRSMLLQCRQGLLQLALEPHSNTFLENSRRDGKSSGIPRIFYAFPRSR